MVIPGAPRGGRVLARRYHLLRVLGRGAMGAVWEAEDTFLRRTVAVKEVVLPGSLSPEERAVSCERTLREARAIARLGHPNVVTLFDVLDEDARPWVVMELVPSRSLADVIKEDGPLHPLRVATVGLAVLGALEAAHAAGITHRDVKPGNILLGHDGRVKLTDFGIARAAGDDTITGTGLLVGSPSYIAPEIIKGQEAGPPADLWGLGATLYAAAEGRAPFSGGDAMETLAKVVQEPPTPYEKSRTLVPALAAMLEKDPKRRAGPVDARRLLLDVLRGGEEAVAAAGRAGPAPAPAAAAAGPATPPAGPGLAALLVPVWRQDRGGASAPPPPAPAAPTAAPVADSTTAGPAAGPTAGSTGAGPTGLAAGSAGPAPGATAAGTTAAGSAGPAAGATAAGSPGPAPGATAAGSTAAGTTAAGSAGPAAGATAAGRTAAGSTAAGPAGGGADPAGSRAPGATPAGRSEPSDGAEPAGSGLGASSGPAAAAAQPRAAAVSGRPDALAVSASGAAGSAGGTGAAGTGTSAPVGGARSAEGDSPAGNRLATAGPADGPQGAGDRRDAGSTSAGPDAPAAAAAAAAAGAAVLAGRSATARPGPGSTFVEADEEDEPDLAERWPRTATSTGPGRPDAGGRQPMPATGATALPGRPAAGSTDPSEPDAPSRPAGSGTDEADDRRAATRTDDRETAAPGAAGARTAGAPDTNTGGAHAAAAPGAPAPGAAAAGRPDPDDFWAPRNRNRGTATPGGAAAERSGGDPWGEAAARAGEAGQRAASNPRGGADEPGDRAGEDPTRARVADGAAAAATRGAGAEPADAGPTVALPSWRPDRPGATTVLGTYGTPARSEDLTQRIAPLPFGGPPPEPPRRAFEPAPGPQQHDPVLPGGLLAERAPAERRRRTVAALLTAIGLLLAAVVGGALLLQGIGPGRDGTGPAEPSGGATALATLPAGYTQYKGDGFTVGVPAAWKPATTRTGVVDVTEPGSDHRFLRLITVRGSQPALEQLTAAEQQFAANKAYAPYARVRLEKVDYRGYDAADWEFTFGARQRHVLYRGIVAGGKTYGLYLSVPASRWEESKAAFRVATDSFRLTS